MSTIYLFKSDLTEEGMSLATNGKMNELELYHVKGIWSATIRKADYVAVLFKGQLKTLKDRNAV